MKEGDVARVGPGDEDEFHAVLDGVQPADGACELGLSDGPSLRQFRAPP
jgi:hypothetical protein